MEYKRRVILNELHYMSFSPDRHALPSMYTNQINSRSSELIIDTIIGMEIDPREGKRYVYFIM